MNQVKEAITCSLCKAMNQMASRRKIQSNAARHLERTICNNIAVYALE